MLQANELRIGNYYNQFGNIRQVNGHTISELEKAPQGQLWCKALPLTEEWLLKFGFEKDGHNNDKTFYYQKDSIKINNYKGYFLDNPNEVVGKRLYIKNVHTLQNLYFALSGEELIYTP
jgi:hypothetical protein